MSAKETSIKDALAGISGEAEAEPQTVEEQVVALREQVAALQRQLTPEFKRSTMTDKQKHNFLREHGVSKYFALPWD
jgi:uncharacterized protein involved in exopolysaccharide biosynthesis